MKIRTHEDFLRGMNSASSVDNNPYRWALTRIADLERQLAVATEVIGYAKNEFYGLRMREVEDFWLLHVASRAESRMKDALKALRS